MLLLGFSAACGHRVTTTPAPAPSAGTAIRYATRPDSTRLTNARLVSLDAERLVFERYQMDPAGRRGVWTLDTVATPSLAKLQVTVGRRGNAGRGALIGLAVGLGLGIACAGEEGGMGSPSDESCTAGSVVMGTATGALIGLLVKSDIWAPAVLPPQPQEPPVALFR
jgi:hypothetical protein